MMVSGTFSELLAPGLNEVFHTAFNEEPQQWQNFFNANSSERAYEEDFTWAGFEPFQEFGELEDIELRNARPGDKTRYVHRKWGLGYQLSRELVDDNMYGNIRQFPEMLARQARHTKETVAASVFNNGFSASFTGADGVALFSTDHPLRGSAGGTQANEFSTARALSHSSLKDALEILRKNKADDGTFSPLTGALTLLVPVELEFRALEILGTERVPYSADNTTNVLRDRSINVVVWPFLTDTDNWFLLGDKSRTKLKYFERWPLAQQMEDKQANLSMVHRAFERYSFGWSHFMGTFGVEGA
jgi:phage major head subunit gpT-like protein